MTDEQADELLRNNEWAKWSDARELLQEAHSIGAEESASELRQLKAENAALRALLTEASAYAEWQDKHIYPVSGKSHQNWLLRVYLPVPLTETDKSVGRALNAVIAAARDRRKSQ